MKKIILYLLLFMTFISLPIMGAKANDASPIITLYDAVVTNPKGANAYEWNWDSNTEVAMVLSYGSEITVVEEYYDDVHIRYNGKMYAVSKNDVGVKSKDYSLTKAVHLDSSKKIMVMADSLNMYSGPSEKFDKLTAIPKSTELSYEYAILTDIESEPSWVYVAYNNKKGWIQIAPEYGNTNVAFEDKFSIKTMADIETEGGVIIPEGVILNCSYSVKNPGAVASFLCEYNNSKYFIADADVEIVLDDDTPNNGEQNTETPKDDTPNNGEGNKPQVVDVKQDKTDLYNLIYICIGAVVLITVTVCITIVLVNKKNKNNEINNQ